MTSGGVVVEVEALGLLCPLPLLRAAQALRRQDGPAEIVLWSDDPAILEDLPRWCAGNGLDLVELIQATHPSGRPAWRGRARKGSGQ